MNEELYLPLKRKWYDMIRSGEKPEEYRAITPYWIRRLTDTHKLGKVLLANVPEVAAALIRMGSVSFKHFDAAHFTLGYPKRDDTSRHMVKPIKEVVIGTGKP